jgi:hypothetical protein
MKPLRGVRSLLSTSTMIEKVEVTEYGMTTKYQPNDANQYAKIAYGTEVVEPEYDPQGNCHSLCSRPAKWLRFEDTAIAIKQWLHDATRKYTWDAAST